MVMKYDFQDIPAVVLAGGPKVAFDANQPAQKKALLRFAGKSSIQYVLDALRGVAQIRRIGIVGLDGQALREVRGASRCDSIPAAGDSMIEHVYSAMRYFAADPAILFVTADAPLVSSESVVDFIEQVSLKNRTHGPNIFIAVVPVDCYRGIYRQVTKAFLRFKDIAVRHGNLAVVDTRLGGDQILKKKLEILYKNRKSAMRSIASLSLRAGLLFLLDGLLGRVMSMEAMARRISNSLGIGLHPVVVAHPGIAVDADEPEDYLFLKRALETKV
ncbi:MAG: hypothetical protein C4519_03340 [Desulfobacteraceae bacterium]|nr:MAG: hypothetical protein C4519_03340 [Desulfobacteraceae bacterium]